MTDVDPEILDAARNAEAGTPDANARRWMLETQTATLCTTLARRGMEGFPYGSVVPFALDAHGRPFILIARIATHTQNLRADPRGALFVRQPGLDDDPQKGWRVTFIGTWERVDDAHPDAAELHARYVERVKWAEGYRETHDFHYWRLADVQTVRYIGGFGEITWISGDRCLRDPGGAGVAEVAPGAIAHMNEDHAHNLLEMVAGRYGVQAASAEMVSLDRTGFLVRTTGPEGLHHFGFGREISGADVRLAVIDVLRRARAHGR